MKKLLTILIFLCCATGIFAFDSLDVKFDSTAFISLGVYEDNSEDANDMELFLRSIRGGFTGIFRYELLPTLSIGVESGIALMTYDAGSHFILDVPVNALGRVGFEFVFIEGHVGYYFSNYNDLSGASSGVKLGLGDWFLDASLILADEVYTRYTFGFQATDML